MRIQSASYWDHKDHTWNHMIILDEETLVKVYDAGSGEGRVHLYGCKSDDRAYDPAGIVRDFGGKPAEDGSFTLADLFGIAGVYMNATTMGHAMQAILTEGADD